MSESDKPAVGSIAWTDLTVDDAEGVRDFYAKVVGWKASPVEMGDYCDFNMTDPDTGNPVVGVCHARGANSDLPAQWLMYVIVENLDSSIGQCRELGGRVLVGPKEMGSHGRYCVIQDPAGACSALIEPA